jgi:hypothetical protein
MTQKAPKSNSKKSPMPMKHSATQRKEKSMTSAVKKPLINNNKGKASKVEVSRAFKEAFRVRTSTIYSINSSEEAVVETKVVSISILGDNNNKAATSKRGSLMRNLRSHSCSKTQM